MNRSRSILDGSTTLVSTNEHGLNGVCAGYELDAGAPVPSWMLSSCWRLLRTRGSFSSPCRVAWRWPTIPPSMRPALITITPGSKILRIPTRRQCCRFGSDLICFLSGSDNTVVLQKIIIARKYMKVINIGTARRSFTLKEQCDENFETHIFAGKKLKNFCVVDETLTCNFRTGTSIQIKCLLLYLSFLKYGTIYRPCPRCQ